MKGWNIYIAQICLHSTVIMQCCRLKRSLNNYGNVNMLFQSIASFVLFLCCRWCRSSDREASTRWCRPAWGRKGWISERSTSSFALTRRRIPSAWCSEWDVPVVSGRDALSSSLPRDGRRGWVSLSFFFVLFLHL